MRYQVRAGLFLILSSAVCFADGDCPDRPATLQERVCSVAQGAAMAAVPQLKTDALKSQMR